MNLKSLLYIRINQNNDTNNNDLPKQTLENLPPPPLGQRKMLSEKYGKAQTCGHVQLENEKTNQFIL